MPDDVILSPDRARERGLTATICFPTGNLAPDGSVIKSTAIDPSLIDENNVYRHIGPARVFITEAAAIDAIKRGAVSQGDVIVLICGGPAGAGMQEIYQITAALKNLPLLQARCRSHRCTLQRRLDRRMHRPHLAGGAGRRRHRARAGRRHDRDRDRPQRAARHRQPGRRGGANDSPLRKAPSASQPGRRATISLPIPLCRTTRDCGPRSSRPAEASGEDASTMSTRSLPARQRCRGATTTAPSIARQKGQLDETLPHHQWESSLKRQATSTSFPRLTGMSLIRSADLHERLHDRRPQQAAS